MKANDVLVIGAGAAGLVVAKELSKAGLQVILLEARNRIGGRTYSFRDSDFKHPLELGAEFIHGNLSTTLRLLKQYRIPYYPVKGRMWDSGRDKDGKNINSPDKYHQLLNKRLVELKRDIPIKSFLRRHFPEKKYAALRGSVLGFVEGYESGDPERFSTMAFRSEWLGAEDRIQYRIDGGYGRLMNSLAAESKRNGCKIHLSRIVEKITWKKGSVTAHCRGGQLFIASRIVIAVPLSILQKEKMKFVPALPEKMKAAKELGFGHVIKILLLFKDKFWHRKALQKQLGENLEKLFFLFSEAPIPTWWTQHPSSSALLTGWLSGSKAKEKMFLTDTQLFEEAMDSLADIFQIKKSVLKQDLISWKVANWSKDEFTGGSYTYATVNAVKYIKKLGAPVNNTLFFSGELFSDGGGTVEDALNSGLNTAKEILKK